MRDSRWNEEDDREDVEADDEDVAFADTYTRLDKDTKASEAFWSHRWPHAEFAWEKRRKPATELGAAIQELVDVASRYRIKPRDFPGLLVERLTDEELKNVMRCLNVTCAHVHGLKYPREYCREEYYHTKEDRVNNARIGFICSGPVRTSHSDSRIGIDELDRNNGAQGCTNEKQRFFLMSDIEGDDVELCYITGFGDAEAPSQHRMHQYVYITHKDTEYQQPRVDVPVVKFTGDRCFSKLSYLNVLRRQWVSLADLAYKKVGELEIDDYETLGEKLERPKACSLRKQADAIRRRNMTDRNAWDARAKKFSRPTGLLEEPVQQPDEKAVIESLRAEVESLKNRLADKEADYQKLEARVAGVESIVDPGVSSPSTSKPEEGVQVVVASVGVVMREDGRDVQNRGQQKGQDNGVLQILGTDMRKGHIT